MSTTASSRSGFFTRLFSWRSARAGLLTAAVFGTLIAAFYVIENIRGRRAWENTRALISANGYTFPRTLSDLAPPAAPPAENAAETPVLRTLYDPDPAVAEAALARWKTTDGEPITPALLERHAASLDELAAAVRRPRLRFPLAYEKGFAMTVPHVGSLLAASKLFSARATLRLQQTDPTGAADDVEAMLHLATLLNREDALLISQLTAAAIALQGQRSLAEGLATNAWSASQRARFATALARIDLIGGLHRSCLGEWGMASIYLEGRPDLRAWMPQKGFGRWLVGPWIPAGWFDQSCALMGRAYMEDIIPSINPAARRVNLARLKQATQELRGIAPGSDLVSMIFPVVERVALQLAERQTQLDFARIALALADWRETHGTYPATLAELPPEADLANQGHDLLTGQPLAYRPAADGATYRLYAFGPDGRDDGGELPGLGQADRNASDWIWSGGGR